MMLPGPLVGPSHYCKNLTSVEAEASCRTSVSLARLVLVQFHHTAVCVPAAAQRPGPKVRLITGGIGGWSLR